VQGDSVTVSDAADRMIERNRVAVDSVVTTDATTRWLLRQRGAPDAIEVTDAAPRIVFYLRSLADALYVTDAFVTVIAGGITYPVNVRVRADQPIVVLSLATDVPLVANDSWRIEVAQAVDIPRVWSDQAWIYLGGYGNA
jgi:hypothetical protein